MMTALISFFGLSTLATLSIVAGAVLGSRRGIPAEGTMSDSIRETTLVRGAQAATASFATALSR